MKQVDEIYPSDIRRTVGPAGTIKRLFSHRDYFEERGYEMRIFVPYIVKKGILSNKTQMREMDSLPTASANLKKKSNTKIKLKEEILY